MRAAFAERLRRGDVIEGFGHPLYPAGDPRATALLDLARTLVATARTRRARGTSSRRLARALALLDLVEVWDTPPSVDVGLAALIAALGLPASAASGLFAVSRSAGWIAHALEQRAAGFLLRPRARYVGLTPRD